MLKDIQFISAELLENNKEIYKYKFIDDKYNKIFNIKILDQDFRSGRQPIAIVNQLLYFIYNEYKYSKECPFVNIRYFLGIRNTNLISDNVIVSSEFYFKHKKTMNKLLYKNMGWYGSYGVDDNTNNYNQYCTYTSNSIYTTAYPVYYINELI